MSLSINSLSYTYAAGSPFELRVINGLSLDIADGEYVGITGKTGSGKSTLVQLISGILKPGEGRVLVDGEDINAKKYDKARLRQKMGVVLQRPEHQLFATTVQGDISYMLKRAGLTETETEARAREAAEVLGLDYEGIRYRSPFSLSDSEKRLVVIAGALALKPKTLILDEPFVLMDAFIKERFLKHLDMLNKGGTTVLLVSGDGEVLAEHAGRIVALKDGELFRDGKTLKVFSEYEQLRAGGISVPPAREAAYMLELPKRTVTYKQLLAGLKTICGGGGK